VIDRFNVLQELNGKNGGHAALRQVLLPEPLPLVGRETIQIVLIREVQDYTILRTEETRELNTVWTQGTKGEVERVAFLGPKQKAAESRQLEGLLRTWNAEAKRTVEKECYLKSQLCLECPRCLLFGATDVSKGSEKGANIKHRIVYGTAFSLLPVDPALRETHTFNGVDEATQRTGQTLGDRESVRPGTLFASVVALRGVTETELVLTLKTILSCTRYGAESRIGGFVRNHALGIVAAHEEVISPLELTVALAGTVTPSASDVIEKLDDYKNQCATPAAAHVLTKQELDALLEAVQKVSVSKELLDAAYVTAKAFRKKQDGYLKKSKE